MFHVDIQYSCMVFVWGWQSRAFLHSDPGNWGVFLSLPSFLPFSLFWTQHWLLLFINLILKILPSVGSQQKYVITSVWPSKSWSSQTLLIWDGDFLISTIYKVFAALPSLPPYCLFICFSLSGAMTQCSTTPWLATWQQQLWRWEIGLSVLLFFIHDFLHSLCLGFEKWEI